MGFRSCDERRMDREKMRADSTAMPLTSYWKGKGIKRYEAVTERMEKFRFNTMISSLMEFVNLLSEYDLDGKGNTQTFQACLETLLVLLAPTAPFITEELWEQMGRPFSIHQQNWPVWDEALTNEEQDVEIPIQVNGRRRGVISILPDEKKDSVVDKAMKVPEIQGYVSSREISRTIYVPGKILNIVTREKSLLP